MIEYRTWRSRLLPLFFCMLIISVGILAQLISFALPRAQAAKFIPNTTVGQLVTSGDPTFDSDSIANSDSTQWRWLSYPGSRLTFNPGNPGYQDTRLTLNAGGWFGNSDITLNTLVQTQLAPQGGSASPAKSVSSTWYPYKLAYTTAYNSPSGSTISGYDYMSDANATMIRVLQDTATTPTNVVLSGHLDGSNGGTWDSTDKVLLVSDTNYYYAIHFADLRGSNLAPVTLVEVPTISGSTWTLTKTYNSGGSLGISIGVAATIEGSNAAVQRALGAIGSSETTTLATTKAYIDGLLQKFPAPTHWGVSGVDALGMTAQQHQRSYYAAVDLILSSLMNPLPENASTYPYPQELCGKPSGYNSGPTGSAGTCTWDSLFGIQLLSYSMPTVAEQVFEGIMSNVQSSGSINGEQLPTREAQTAWIIYNQSHDVSFLQTIYPNLKKYLLWAEQNPRWSGRPSENDSEFVSSWIYDARFAIDIANTLGLSSDVSLWQSGQATLTSNYQTWFFGMNTIYEYYYTNGSAPGLPPSPEYVPTGLIIPGLSAPFKSRLLSYFDTQFAPNSNKALGLLSWKYPDLSLIITGLNENNQGTAASQLANGAVRDVVKAVQFSENVVAGPSADGVRPGLFSSSAMVNLTWMLNGADTETGPITPFSFGSGGALTFGTGLETGDPQPTWTNAVDNGGGSSGGLSNVTGSQLQVTNETSPFLHYGKFALQYAGQATGGSVDYAYLKAFDFSASPLPVSTTSKLSYWIYPQSSTANPNVSGDNSTCVSIDLVFTDGTALRNYAAAVDQNGYRITPSSQCGELQLDAWNLVTVNLGTAVTGKSIARLDVAYDQPGSTGGYSGYVDDIAISS